MRNPLRYARAPYHLPVFDEIRPEHVLPALDELLAAYRHGVAVWFENGAEPDWAMVEYEIDWADDLARAWSPISHLHSVADTDALREVYKAALERLTEHSNWRQQHRGIYEAYRALRDSPKFSGLTPVQQRIVELELRDFHLAGVDLPPERQADYRELTLGLSKLGTSFAENLLDATQAWTRHFPDRKGLAGLPEQELALLAGIAEAHGKQGYIVDLNGPAFQAIMTHAEDRKLREAVYAAFVTRASDQGGGDPALDNGPLIAEMLDLRYRLARLLDFDDYVHYSLSTRMADSAATVLAFLEDLAERAVPAAREQFEALQSFAGRHGAPTPLEPWDVAFWSERLRQAELHLSDEELKPYFSLPRMLDALEYTVSSLFGVKLERDDSVATWHEDVFFLWLIDEDGRRFAGVYLDLYARQGKRGGAWMDVCLSRRRTETGLQLPVAYLTCNFSPPVEDRPSLLTHHDVETLFHEFGHCLHHLLTEIDWPQVNGINNVEWDAVELPSQLFEKWGWEDALLTRFARHYETGDAMPEGLKQRLLKSHRFMKAMFLVRQLEFALTDLRLHLEYDPDSPPDPQRVIEDVRRRVAVVEVPGWNRFLNGFSHVFGGGYSAGYYSYLWAEQLAADAWGRFEESGAFDAGTGRALRDEILAVGSGRPALESFIAFRGRPPATQPLLKNYGLI